MIISMYLNKILSIVESWNTAVLISKHFVLIVRLFVGRINFLFQTLQES